MRSDLRVTQDPLDFGAGIFTDLENHLAPKKLQPKMGSSFGERAVDCQGNSDFPVFVPGQSLTGNKGFYLGFQFELAS